MTVCLLCLAAALLAWPSGVGRLGGRRRTRAVARVARLPAGPFLVACAAAVPVALVSTVLVGCLAGACVGAAARAWLARRGEARAGAALLALAELLGVLAAELRSGRPVEGAIETAVAACGDESFSQTVGPGLRAAASGGLTIVPGGLLSAPTQRITAAVRLSSRTGCSLAAVLTAVEDDLRARHREELEARIATAGPRASAALLAGLPVLALAMGGGIGAHPWQVLTTTAAGQLLLVTGVGLELAGVAWSGRLVRRALR